MYKPYFGTDGIRGKVGHFPMQPHAILKIALAYGRFLLEKGVPAEEISVLIAKDTRASSEWILAAFVQALLHIGISVYELGVVPTPVLAFFAKQKAVSGIMITASHNPYTDNGIKFFTAEGAKLVASDEQTIVAFFEEVILPPVFQKRGKYRQQKKVNQQYLEYCQRAFYFPKAEKPLKLVVDCANGAASTLAPYVLTDMGFDVLLIHHKPDGFNINRGCGATAMQSLQSRVQLEKADIGIAFDGDGDRLLVVDHTGEVLDGDTLLYLLATVCPRTSEKPAGIVGTVMSNSGLALALAKKNIGFKRAAVGDKAVLTLLKETGWTLGGEPSGHIVDLSHGQTGDALWVALCIITIVAAQEESLYVCRQSLHKRPQKLVNVPLNNPQKAASDPSVIAWVQEVEHRYAAEKPYILLRASGTEPVLRILVEADKAASIEEIIQEALALFRKFLGA